MATPRITVEKLRFNDTDMLGHINNAIYSVILEAGRVGRAVAPFLLAALASVLTISITGVSVAQLWWTTLLGAVALAFAVVLRAQTRSDRVQAGVLKERPTVKI